MTTAKKISKLSQGAEGVIYIAESGKPGEEAKEATIIKDRIKKNYRLDKIDFSLRKHRTRKEAKVLDKLKEIGLDSPDLIVMDDENMIIEMSYIDGPKLRDVLNKNHRKFSREIGKKIAIMHNNSIIHGDLTTSNMILDQNEKIHFIDFGLSFFSEKIEDKAVDLHLIKHALESKHYDIFEECFESVLEEYKKTANDADKILRRFEVVEARGRNKEKV